MESKSQLSIKITKKWATHRVRFGESTTEPIPKKSILKNQISGLFEPLDRIARKNIVKEMLHSSYKLNEYLEKKANHRSSSSINSNVIRNKSDRVFMLPHIKLKSYVPLKIGNNAGSRESRNAPINECSSDKAIMMRKTPKANGKLLAIEKLHITEILVKMIATPSRAEIHSKAQSVKEGFFRTFIKKRTPIDSEMRYEINNNIV